MAIQDKTGTIRGKVGSVVYKQWRGLNIIQGRPRRSTQSVATKAAAVEFGRASATAANIRKTLQGFYLSADVGMNNRLTKQVLKSMQNSEGKERLERDIHDANTDQLINFQFNINSPLHDALPVIPEVTVGSQGVAEVKIPAFKRTDIRYTGEHSKDIGYRLRVLAIGFDFRNEYAEVLEVKDIRIRDHQEEINWKLEEQLPAGMILMVGLALYAEYYAGTERMLLNSRDWSPAAIVGIAKIAESETEIKDQTARYNHHREKGTLSRFGTLQHPCCKEVDVNLLRRYKEFLSFRRCRDGVSKERDEMHKGKISLKALC